MQPRYFFRLLDVVRRLDGNPLTPLTARDVRSMGDRWGLSFKNAQRYVIAGRAVATVLAEDGLTLRLERKPCAEEKEVPDNHECPPGAEPDGSVPVGDIRSPPET